MAAGRDGATLRRMEELSRDPSGNPDDLAACREYYKLWFTPFFGCGQRTRQPDEGNVCAAPRRPSGTNRTSTNLPSRRSETGIGAPPQQRAVVPTLLIHGDRDPLP
jgi:hypothetical protein